MNKEELIRNLKYTKEKHKNDFVPTFGTNISLMCEDILNYLELEQRWIPVSEELPLTVPLPAVLPLSLSLDLPVP